MDYAGAAPAPGMTTRSLRPLLAQGDAAAAQYRPFVSSGLANFRLVVQRDAASGTQYKYICCQGPCPNAPSTAPAPRTPDAFVEMLIDVVSDPFDMHDLAPTKRDVVGRMRQLLPPAYAEGCAKAN